MGCEDAVPERIMAGALGMGINFRCGGLWHWQVKWMRLSLHVKVYEWLYSIINRRLIKGILARGGCLGQ